MSPIYYQISLALINLKSIHLNRIKFDLPYTTRSKMEMTRCGGVSHLHPENIAPGKKKWLSNYESLKVSSLIRPCVSRGTSHGPVGVTRVASPAGSITPRQIQLNVRGYAGGWRTARTRGRKRGQNLAERRLGRPSGRRQGEGQGCRLRRLFFSGEGVMGGEAAPKMSRVGIHRGKVAGDEERPGFEVYMPITAAGRESTSGRVSID